MEGKILVETIVDLRVNVEWVGADNRRGNVDKVLGLLQCVCRRSLREMIASVGSEWRLPREISMWFGGTDLRLLGCLFVFLTGPWMSNLWMWRR